MRIHVPVYQVHMQICNLAASTLLLLSAALFMHKLIYVRTHLIQIYTYVYVCNLYGASTIATNYTHTTPPAYRACVRVT